MLPPSSPASPRATSPHPLRGLLYAPPAAHSVMRRFGFTHVFEDRRGGCVPAVSDRLEEALGAEVRQGQSFKPVREGEWSGSSGQTLADPARSLHLTPLTRSAPTSQMIHFGPMERG